MPSHAGIWEKRYRREIEAERDRDSSWVISFPKSGRTWHRVALGAYLALRSGRDLSSALDLEQLCEACGVPIVRYSHNGANFIDGLPSCHPGVASPELWQGRRVLLLVRDPRDVLVSAYHHARYREALIEGDLSTFIRGDVTGIHKIMQAYRRWFLQSSEARSFDIISYEQMTADTLEAMKRSLKALGLEDIESNDLAGAVRFAEFRNMARSETDDFFRNGRLRLTSADPRARKVREGRVGGFRDHFSDDDHQYVAGAIAAVDGDPFASYYEVGRSEADCKGPDQRLRVFTDAGDVSGGVDPNNA